MNKKQLKFPFNKRIINIKDLKKNKESQLKDLIRKSLENHIGSPITEEMRETIKKMLGNILDKIIEGK